MFGFGGSNRSDFALEARIRRLERKLDAIVEQLGITLPADDDKDLHELAASGRVIEAIKLYRQRYGVGLAEAKAAVDQMREG